MRVRFLVTLLPCLVAAACYGPTDFQEESAVARCSLYEECSYLSSLGADSFEDCLELLRSDAYTCEEFNAQAATACIEALEVLTCDEYSGGGFPMECIDACTLAE